MRDITLTSPHSPCLHFFFRAKKYSFSESSSSVCLIVPLRLFKVLAQFKLPTFNGAAPTVQNYPSVGFMVLYVRTNRVVVGKIERNLKPLVLVAVDRCKV